MTTVTVALEDDLAKQLASFTLVYNLSNDMVIRLALQKFLAPQASPIFGDALAGMFDFGTDDFAERSEEILQAASIQHGSWTAKP